MDDLGGSTQSSLNYLSSVPAAKLTAMPLEGSRMQDARIVVAHINHA